MSEENPTIYVEVERVLGLNTPLNDVDILFFMNANPDFAEYVHGLGIRVEIRESSSHPGSPYYSLVVPGPIANNEITMQGFLTELGDTDEVADEVDRLIASRNEVIARIYAFQQEYGSIISLTRDGGLSYETPAGVTVELSFREILDGDGNFYPGSSPDESVKQALEEFVNIFNSVYEPTHEVAGYPIGSVPLSNEDILYEAFFLVEVHAPGDLYRTPATTPDAGKGPADKGAALS
jgi:hypothetical protein